MVTFSILQPFIIALALGALVGLEREYARYKKRGHDYAGIRTFPLIALLGSLAAFFGETINIWILITTSALIGILIIVAYFVKNQSHRDTGATSEVAGFVTYFLGILAFHNELILAITIAIVMTILLYSRSILHRFAEKMKKQELADTLKFAVIAFLILPLLPNQAYGPHGIFNPFIIWLMVVFISGISFAGYILMKWFGQRGIPLTGILGGLASSTATTISFAQRSNSNKKLAKALALGVILANGIMFIRILFEVLVVNRALLRPLLIPMLSLAGLTILFAYLLWRGASKTKKKITLKSPFTIKPALTFGIFFAVILALVKIAEVYFSSRGIYIASFISGFADVDAITLSLAQLAKTSISVETARNGIIIATLTNVAVKGGIAFWFGTPQFRKYVVGAFALLIAAGIGLLFI